MSDLQVRGDVYAEDIKKSLEELAKATNKSSATLVRDRAPMMARYLASWTMPVAGIQTGNPDGGSLEAKLVGEKAVTRDINRVYLGANKIIEALKNMHNAKTGNAMARAFFKAGKQGDVATAQQIIRRSSLFAGLEVMMFDGGKKHKAAMQNGRVPKNKKPTVVMDVKNLREYVDKTRRNVGWTKAAWINAGKQIKGGGGPVRKWITRHAAAPASGVFMQRLALAESRLTSGVQWVDRKIDDRRAMEAFDKNMKASIQIALQKIAESEQRKK